jgi:catechol 2,3-dioxygenase-like lactoylglutathione lyase family enzyme
VSRSIRGIAITLQLIIGVSTLILYSGGMDPESQDGRGRVLGIGGVFFKSPDRSRMQSWYAANLGMAPPAEAFEFHWRSHDQPETEHMTVWSVFPSESTYFDPSAASFMINYIVDDLDAILEKMARNGVRIDPKREDHEYGRFAWIYDPDGNKIELWQPPKS